MKKNKIKVIWKLILLCLMIIGTCCSCELFTPTLFNTWNTLVGSTSISSFFIDFTENSYETRFFSGICNSFSSSGITKGVRGDVEVNGNIITFYPKQNYVDNEWIDVIPEVESSQATFEIIEKELNLYLDDFPAKHFYGENSSYTTWTTTLDFDKGKSTC